MARLSDDAWRLRRENYPLAVEIRAAYGDVDSFHHLNNVALARFLEEGRATMNMQVFGVDAVVRPSGDVQLLFASVTIDYIAQGTYPGTVTVAVAASRVGGSSYVQSCGVFQNGRCIALCDAVTVYAAAGRGAPLPPDARATLETLKPKN
ncbi:MAG: acyl-CoA thioesterase [Phenylobacterium sp.]